MPVRKDTLVQVAVTKRERTRWASAARELDMSTSEFVREAVRARLNGFVRLVDGIDILPRRSMGGRAN